jgi:hypothetical protein
MATAMSVQKYLSTSEMVTGIQKKTKLPIRPVVPIPGDFRVYRPSKYDVLCGRGKPIQDHTGNLRMRKIVTRYTERYFNSRKHKKQEIVEEVVRLVKNSEGVLARFLKRVGRENYWVDVSNSVACDKVSHALRCMVRKGETGEPQEDESPRASPEPAIDDSEREEKQVKTGSSEPARSPADTKPEKTRSVTESSKPQGATESSAFKPVAPIAKYPAHGLSPGAAQSLVDLAPESPAGNDLRSLLSLQQLSDSQLIELVAKERIYRKLRAPAPEAGLEGASALEQLAAQTQVRGANSAVEQLAQAQALETLIHQKRLQDSLLRQRQLEDAVLLGGLPSGAAAMLGRQAAGKTYFL